MKISTRARYALRIMIDLAENSFDSDDVHFIKLKDVAERQEISKDYLVHLVTALKTASLVRSSCGKKGGYALTLPPEEIKVLDIVEAVIGPIKILDCLSDRAVCHRSPGCRSRKVWDILNDKIRETLEDVTLDEISNGFGTPARRSLEKAAL